jgi:large-conductance mechanosensitive channel
MEKIKVFINSYKKGLKVFGEHIALLVNFILLTFVYFFAVGPTALIARLFKKQFLDLKLSKKSKSYWTKTNLEEKNSESYYQQF